MKKYVAKTIDDALELAAGEMGVAKEEICYEVLEEKKGLFSKKAEIAVYELSDAVAYAQKYLETGIAQFGIAAQTTARITDEIIHIKIESDHNSILIGKNGRTLQALNELTKLAVSAKFKKRYRILLDINDYKDGKYDKIISIAKRVARDVQRTKVTATLDAMPADERRVVHNALNGMPHIKTESIGEGQHRQITIKYME